jgi:hypothetical protein
LLLPTYKELYGKLYVELNVQQELQPLPSVTLKFSGTLSEVALKRRRCTVDNNTKNTMLKLAEELVKLAKQKPKENKKMINLYVDRDLWDRFHERHGRNSSKIVADFLQAYLDAEDKAS